MKEGHNKEQNKNQQQSWAQWLTGDTQEVEPEHCESHLTLRSQGTSDARQEGTGYSDAAWAAGKPNRTIKEAHWLFWWEGGSNNEKLNNVRKMV